MSRRRDKKDSMQQQIELPHDCDGEVDWRTLGNMLAAHLLGEVLCASYVDYKYGRRCKDFLPDTDWEFAYEEHDVIVFRKRLKDCPIHCFMGRGVIDLPMENVVSFVRDLQSRKQWDKYLVEIREAKKFSEKDHLVYMFHRAKECLVKAEREFLYFSRIIYTPDGKYVQSSLSVEHPDFPPMPGITRAKILLGSGWVIEPYEGSNSRTLASYLAHLDLVSLPALITNRVMRRQPMAIHYIRNILAPSTPGIERWPDISSASITSAPAAPYSHLSNYSDTMRSHHFEQPLSVTAFTGVPRPYSVPSGINRIGNGESHTQTHTHGADTSLIRRSRVTSEPGSLNAITCGSPSSHRDGINIRSPAFLRPLEKSPIPNRIKTEATGPGPLSEEEEKSNSIEDSGESTPRASTPNFEPHFHDTKNPSTTATSASFFNTQNGEGEGVNDLTNSFEGRTSNETKAGGMPRTNSGALENTPEPAVPFHASRDASRISSSTGSNKRSSTTPEPRAPATSRNGPTLQPTLGLLQNGVTTYHGTDPNSSGRLPITPSHYQNGTTNTRTDIDLSGSGSLGLAIVLSTESSESFYTAQGESTPEGDNGKALHSQTDSEPLPDHVGKVCALSSSFGDLEQPSATSEKFNVMISL